MKDRRKKGFNHTGVSVVYFCHNGQGKFVMHKRGRNCRDEQGVWDIGGGGLEFGEKVIANLKKEIGEEYSATVLEYEFLGYRDVHRVYDNKPTHWITLDFKVLVDPGEVKNNEPDKFDEVKWFSLDKLPEKMHSALGVFFEIYKDRL